MLYNNTITYKELLNSFPPRPIKSEEDLEKTQAVVDALIGKEQLTDDERDYLKLLGTLIHEYEEKQDIVPDIFGVELLKVLMAEKNLKQKDLAFIFKTESIVSDVLRYKRKLKVEHIQKLAVFFNVSPAVFFPVNLSASQSASQQDSQQDSQPVSQQASQPAVNQQSTSSQSAVNQQSTSSQPAVNQQSTSSQPASD
jgi:HTH-type transcriptional regulator/antitoxin HigA